MEVITVFFELSSFIIYFFSLFYLFHYKKEFRSIIQILSATTFGLTLEFASVLIFKVYTYSENFIVQIGRSPNNIPICIALGWGMIIYSCMRISDQFNFPLYSRPFMDTLLALTIDLSMDTIAIRIEGGFWRWIDVPLEPAPTFQSFFGVNYGNFVGWFYIVLIFSTLIRIYENWLVRKIPSSIIIKLGYYSVIPFFAYLPLLVGLLTLLPPLNFISGHPLVFTPDNLPNQTTRMFEFLYLLLISFVIIALGYYRRHSVIKLEIEIEIEIVPLLTFLFFHITFLLAYLLLGLATSIPLMLPLTLGMAGIDALIHISLLRAYRKQNITQRIPH